MRFLIIFLFCIASLFGSQYYAKLQPIETYNIQSSVNGIVTFANKQLQNHIAHNQTIVKLDDEVEQIDLKNTKQKLAFLEEILKLEQGILQSFNKVSSKSKFDKDNQKIKILNIKSSIADIKTKIKQLQQTIKHKNIVANNLYIYEIKVVAGDYINVGKLLYTAMDISKGKFTIYIPYDQKQNIKSKTIYIDDQKTNLKISNLYKVTDSKHLSSYKCEIITDKFNDFSKLYKIDFK